MTKKPVSAESYDEKYFLTDCGGYDLYNRSGGRVLDDRLQLLLCLAFLGEGDVVLDVGCGRGEVLAYCHENNIRAWGIDYSESATGISRQTVTQGREAGRSTVAISRADAKQLPFRAGSFDKIVLADVVEHLHTWELDLLLKECARALKAEGLIIIHTRPNGWYYPVRHTFRRLVEKLKGRSLPRNARTHYEREMHVREHTYFSLKAALNKCFRSEVWFASGKANLYYDLLRAKKAWPFNCLTQDLWAVACLKRSRVNLGAFVEREMEAPTTLSMGGLEANFLRGDWHSAEYSDPPMRWTGKRAGVILNGKDAEKVVVKAFCSKPGIEENPMSLAIRINGKRSNKFKFHRPGLEAIAIPIEQRDRVSNLRVDLEVGETWVPKDLNINDDPRELGVGVVSVWADNGSKSGAQV
jgi:ubiquinone/menaquinone biosynthesis C-methylase UbiE